MKKEKVLVNLTQLKDGWRASAHFTYLTKHAFERKDAIRHFTDALKLRNFVVAVKPLIRI